MNNTIEKAWALAGADAEYIPLFQNRNSGVTMSNKFNLERALVGDEALMEHGVKIVGCHIFPADPNTLVYMTGCGGVGSCHLEHAEKNWKMAPKKNMLYVVVFSRLWRGDKYYHCEAYETEAGFNRMVELLKITEHRRTLIKTFEIDIEE